MKKMFSIAFAIILISAVPELANAQKYSNLDKSPLDIAYFRPDGRNSTPIAKVWYSRPQKKGREMLGQKEPFGKVWRLGANETTEIKFFRDVNLGGKSISAGTYALYAIPNADKWTIIVNSKTDTWGAFGYDESKDVARFDVPVEKPASEVEAFSIAFGASEEGGKMYIAWENYQVAVPIK